MDELQVRRRRPQGSVSTRERQARRHSLPTKIRTAFQDPIELDRDPERAEDERYVKASYREARDSIQAGMDTLARRRRLPRFG